LDRKWFKGRAAMALDAWYRHDVGTNLESARDWLSSDLSFEEMTGRLNAGKAEADFDFDYPMPQGSLRGDDFERVTRQGYLEAIALALGHSPPVPIKTYWMTGVGNEAFEMHVSDGAQHVSVTLLVPDVDGGSEHPRSPESWVVTIDGGEVRTAQTSGPPNEAPPSARGPDTD
jgi:hypothetical protein